MTSTDSARTTCPACGGDASGFHSVENAAVNSVLNIATREEALAFPCGSIDLSVCTTCGFIFNRSFQPDLVSYKTGYEATQAYSGTFSAFARAQAEKLIADFGLQGKKVVEIGCGTGEFLTMLCALGDNQGIGYDPAYVEGRSSGEPSAQVSFVKDFYRSDCVHPDADLVFCRMTLEHIPQVHEFVSSVRTAIGDAPSRVFFQVPNATRVLADCAFEDIYYEHCSYFTAGSLTSLFERCGFTVLATETAYDEQYLTIEAKPGDGGAEADAAKPGDVAGELELTKGFSAVFAGKREAWDVRLKRYREGNKRGVIWGAGSKAVSFLTSVSAGEEVYAGVDINPHRQGMFMPRTGHEIVSPESLTETKPDSVIIMNDVYRDEIGESLKKLGLSPEVLGVHSLQGETVT